MAQMKKKKFKYAYDIDLSSDTTPAKVLRLVGRGKKVLELGCGPGHMSRVMRDEFGCRVTGIEIDRKAAKEALHFCEDVKVVDLDRSEMTDLFPENSFDVIVMADVLEHLKRPEKVLKQSKKLLKGQGGRLVISIPNAAYMGITASLISGEFPYSDIGLLDKTHLRFFTGSSFRSLLREHGLEIIQWDTYEVPVEYTEFKRAFEGLPGPIKGFLARCPDSCVYQFILSAAPSRQASGRKKGNAKGDAPDLHEWLDFKMKECIKERDKWFENHYFKKTDSPKKDDGDSKGFFKRLRKIVEKLKA